MSCEHNRIPTMHIGKAIASQWVRNYRTIKRPLLAGSAGPDGDTNSILYDMKKWRELMDEAICQGATGIRIYFGAYSEHPTLPGEGLIIPKDANKNLTVVFVLTRKDMTGIDRDIFLEEQSGYEERLRIKIDEFESKVRDLDTGTPCPPASCSNGLP